MVDKNQIIFVVVKGVNGRCPDICVDVLERFCSGNSVCVKRKFMAFMIYGRQKKTSKFNHVSMRCLFVATLVILKIV